MAIGQALRVVTQFVLPEQSHRACEPDLHTEIHQVALRSRRLGICLVGGLWARYRSGIWPLADWLPGSQPR